MAKIKRRQQPKATEVWFMMNSLVRDHAIASRDQINRLIDMPFSRFRALRRVAVRDMTQVDLARRLGVDAPAVSLIVNDLAHAGLVERRPDPTDGRRKVVAITEDGQRAVAAVIEDPASAPPMFEALDAQQLANLENILRTLGEAGER